MIPAKARAEYLREYRQLRDIKRAVHRQLREEEYQQRLQQHRRGWFQFFVEWCWL